MVLLVQTGILSQGHSQGSCHATLGQRVSPIAVSNRGEKVIPESVNTTTTRLMSHPATRHQPVKKGGL